MKQTYQPKTINGMYVTPSGMKGVLIYDIETATYIKNKVDPERDTFKVFGCYSYDTGKVKVLPYTQKDKIQKIINSHKFLVGYNNIDYDNPVLERFGFNLKGKKFIDMLKILKDRAPGMTTKKGMLGQELMEYTLDYVTKFLDLVDDRTGKGSLDYELLRKIKWNHEDIIKIKEYTERDIFITKKLFDWLAEYFDGFKDFIPKHDIDDKKYLSDTIAKFAYKAICFALYWEPVYNHSVYENGNEEKSESFDGGYVAYPSGERYTEEDGDIYIEDFNSLYPHIMIMCNLYGRCKKGEQGWSGGGVWDVEGTYNDKELHPVGELLKSWYYLRLFYKRQLVFKDDTIRKMIGKSSSVLDYIGEEFYQVSHNSDGKVELKLTTLTKEIADEYYKLAQNGKDPREYTVKIILNTIYGLLTKEYYQLVYDEIAGPDCTGIGRQWTKYYRKEMHNQGYKIIYSDTDSIMIVDPFRDKERMMKVKQKIINYIKSTVPFPQPTFDAGIDAEIKYMYFFKGKSVKDKASDIHMDELDHINKPKGFMKKNYIYVQTDGKLVIKNLGVKKKSNSAISKKIFWDYMVPDMKEKGIAKFNKIKIDNIMKKLIREDITLCKMRKNVKHISQYKRTSDFAYKISQRYGEGIHFLVPNIRGIGVRLDKQNKSYCTFEEFEKHKMEAGDIDFSVYWDELGYFLEESTAQKTLFSL